jgi:hypothetical protein
VWAKITQVLTPSGGGRPAPTRVGERQRNCGLQWAFYRRELMTGCTFSVVVLLSVLRLYHTKVGKKVTRVRTRKKGEDRACLGGEKLPLSVHFGTQSLTVEPSLMYF